VGQYGSCRHSDSHASAASLITVTVTVTEALVLRPILRPRAHHRVNPYLVARRQDDTKVFSDHDGSLFHARGAATEKALLPIRRRVCGTTRLPHDEAQSVDRAGILATDVRRSEIHSGVCPRSDL